MTVAYLIIAAFVVVAIYFGIRYFVRSSQRFSGERVIISHPEQRTSNAATANRRIL